MSLLSRFFRRNVIADDPTPELSTLDRLDRERSMADHPAGKRRPAVRPTPESLEEALSERDLFAVARGAGVAPALPPLDHPGWDRLLDEVDSTPTEPGARIVGAAMRHFRETGDLDGALAIYRGRESA